MPGSGPDAGLPDLPRLVAGCCLFEDGGHLIIRSVHGAFAIEPAHSPAMKRVLAKLDGRHDFVALLGGEAAPDAFYILRLLDWFTQSGLLADGPSGPAAAKRGDAAVRLDGVTLVFTGDGLLSRALQTRLATLGAEVSQNGGSGAAGRDVILVACQDGPNVAKMQRANQVAAMSGLAWLPVLPFGDAVVAGPLFRPGRTACFRCFELRWLGRSPAAVLEAAFWRHSRLGGWRAHCLPGQAVEELAPRIATAIAPQLASTGGRPANAVLVPREAGADADMPVERHPSCDVCGTADSRRHLPAASTAEDWSGPAPRLAAIARNLAPLAQGRCGLVALMPPPRNQPRHPGLPHIAIARFSLPVPDQAGSTQDNWCHGTAARRDDAEAIAKIEAVERYAGLSPATPCLRAPYAAVAARALLPTDLPLFSPAQHACPGFAFRPFDPRQPLDWSEGFNLSRGTPILVPTAAAWYGQDDELVSETSSGVAAHGSRGLALLNGALELVERDAFMIHWLNRLSPPLLDPGQITAPLSRALAAHVQEAGCTLRIADLTTDLAIPAWLALGIRRDRQGPALLAGAGASLDPGRALHRALRELYAALSTQAPHWTLPPALALDQVASLEDHHLAYQHPDWLPHAAFLWASDRQATALPARSDDLGTLTCQLGLHGHELIGVDITSPDVAHHGLHVVRAIIPGLQPLGFGSNLRLGGRRLHEAPVRMGHRGTPSTEASLNRVPHCFP